MVPSRTDHGEIDARDWYAVGGGEGGYIAVDPKNHNIVYVGNTAGRWRASTYAPGRRRTSRPLRRSTSADPSTRKYRFPWTPPLVFSAAGPEHALLRHAMPAEDDRRRPDWQEITGRPDRRHAQGQSQVPGPITRTTRAKARYGRDLYDRPRRPRVPA